MIFDLHREPLHAWIERRSFRHSPRKQHSFEFEPKVVVQLRCSVFLNDIQKMLIRRLFRRLTSRRFGRHLEISLLLIFRKRHVVPQSFFKRLDAAAKFCRLLKKSAQGPFRLNRSRKLPRLKVVGSSEVFTSSHASGIENGACGLRRTEYGVTTVWTAPFRNGSRYTRLPRSAIACSTVNSFGYVPASRATAFSANRKTSSEDGPTRIGTKTWSPRLPEVFGNDSRSSESSTSLSSRPAFAASANFPDVGSRSKQIQSGFGKVLARLPVT